MDKILIKVSDFENLIFNTINHFTDEQKTFDLFYEFLRKNSFIDDYPICICTSTHHSFYIDIHDKTYGNLSKAIREFLIEITNLDIEHPSKIASCVFNYLYVVYYRAMVKINRNEYFDSFNYGMSVDQAYGYLYGTAIRESSRDSVGLIELFSNFCIRYNLTSSYIDAQNVDKSFFYLFKYLHEQEDLKKFIKKMDDKDFYKILSSFKNRHGFLDYRLFAEMLLKAFEILEERKHLMSESLWETLEILISNRKGIVTIRDCKKHVNFNEYTEEDFAINSFMLPMLLFLSKEKNQFMDENLCSILFDINQYGAFESIYESAMGKVNLQQKLKGVVPNMCDNQIKDDSFEKFLYEELDRRNEKIYKELREEAEKISLSEKGKNTIKFYVMKFLKNGLKARYTYSEQKVFTKEDLDSLYSKMKKSSEVIEIIAAFEKRFEDSQENGIDNDDYTYLLCGPIKLIEKMLKLELKENYSTCAFKCTNKDNRGRSTNGRWRSTDEPLDPDENTIYRNVEIGKAIVSLQNAMISSRKPIPWFLASTRSNCGQLTTYCKFYSEFGMHVRNGYFHTDTISSLDEGIQLYYKVAYWFEQCLFEFNPYA